MDQKSTREDENIYLVCRLEAGLTRAAAAEMLGDISAGRLVQIESGATPTSEEIVRLAECYLNKKNDAVEDDTEDSDEYVSYTFHYIISFLIPLIGFILGAILLAKDDGYQRNCGKTCIILGIVSIAIGVVLSFLVFSSALASVLHW